MHYPNDYHPIKKPTGFYPYHPDKAKSRVLQWFLLKIGLLRLPFESIRIIINCTSSHVILDLELFILTLEVILGNKERSLGGGGGVQIFTDNYQ